MRTAVCCILFIFSSLNIFAKSSFFPGYYIDKVGDTIKCVIEFGDWGKTPKTIHITINGESKEFTPFDIKGFGVDGYGNYKSADVSYHVAPLSGYLTNFTDSIVMVTCFLQNLSTGRYPLFIFSANDGNHFFYKSDGGFVELIYRERVNEGILEKDQSYRQQMLNLFDATDLSGKYSYQINNAAYSSSDLNTLFNILNGNKSASTTNSSLGFQPQIFAGAAINNFPSLFNGIYLNQIKADSYTSPSGGVNMLISVPGKFKTLKFGVGVLYDQYKINIDKTWSTDYIQPGTQYTTTYHEVIKGKSSVLVGNLYLMWVVNPLNKLQAYAKAGGSYNFFLNKDRNFVSNASAHSVGTKNNGEPFDQTVSQSLTLLEEKDSYLSFMLSAGLKYGRHGFEFSYWPPAQTISAANPQINNYLKTGFMGIYHYFSLTKENKF